MLTHAHKSNILVDEFGKACLSDFGLAKIKTYSTTIHKELHVSSGTVRWMAPEQLRTGLITRQTDIYGFGMTMYEVRLVSYWHKLRRPIIRVFRVDLQRPSTVLRLP